MRVTPEQHVEGFEAAGTVLDFWQWAFGDLCDDDIKGWFAEWLVARLLNIETKRRISWADSDLIVGTGAKHLRIEVKSTAFWQSYKLLDEFGDVRTPAALHADARKRLRWSGLQSRAAKDVATLEERVSLKSDLYVFALQTHEDHETWNALDIGQWEFYLAKKEQLALWNSVTLKHLEEMGAGPMTANEFSVQGRKELAARGFAEFIG